MTSRKSSGSKAGKRKRGRKECNEPRRRSALIMSAACCAPPLKKARERRANGEITAAVLKDVEDREIAAIIKKQEEVGLLHN
jgi:hypothetical protein